MLRLTLLASLVLLGDAVQPTLALEFRVFRGLEEVTARSRVTVHRAGERDRPVAQMRPGQPHTVSVPAGIYDAQAIEEQDGRVVNIRWAERLVVMPYPDEQGHHLEVINLETGYGALQVRGAAGTPRIDEIALFPVTDPRHPVASAPERHEYYLFVVRAGQYDLQVRRGPRAPSHAKIEVPADRTRFYVVP